MNEAFCVVRQNLEKVFLLKMRFGLSNPNLATVDPQYNDGRAKGLCQNLFAITRFLFFEILFHIFYYYYYWGKENRLLYQALRYIDLLMQLLLK